MVKLILSRMLTDESKKEKLVKKYGVSYVNIFPVKLCQIERASFRKYLEEDEFGVYKKKGVKIPLRYRHQYFRLNYLRTEQLLAKYLHLSINQRTGRNCEYYVNECDSERTETEKQ